MQPMMDLLVDQVVVHLVVRVDLMGLPEGQHHLVQVEQAKVLQQESLEIQKENCMQVVVEVVDLVLPLVEKEEVLLVDRVQKTTRAVAQEELSTVQVVLVTMYAGVLGSS